MAITLIMVWTITFDDMYGPNSVIDFIFLITLIAMR